MLSIAIGGDVCFAGKPDTNEASAREYLRAVKPLLDRADFRVVNLETAISARGRAIVKTGPSLNGSVENLGFLRAGRFDAVILANNHVGDYGDAGVMETLRNLDDMRMPHFGAGADLDEAYRALAFEKEGLRVSLLAVCENEFGIARRNAPGVAGFNMERLAASIEREKSASDFVVVIFHGGSEYNPLPTPGQRARYRAIIRFGADAVIGMHPHCPEGYEAFNGAPIAYSLGNLFFLSKSAEPSWYCGMIATLSFEKGAKPTLALDPYRFDENLTQVTPFEGEARARMDEYIARISAPITNDALLEDYYKGWCMLKGLQSSRLIAFDYKRARDDEYRFERGFASMRNLYSCEAHNELLTELMRVIERGETAFADEMANELQKLKL